MVNCRNCPYIRDEYGELQYIEDDYVPQYCECDKVGGKISWYGKCEDAIIQEPKEKPIKQPQNSKEKRKNRRNNNERIKNKYKWQWEHIKSYPSPAYPVDKNGQFDNNNPAYYKITNKSAHTDRYKYYKKLSNRKLRQQLKNVYLTLQWEFRYVPVDLSMDNEEDIWYVTTYGCFQDDEGNWLEPDFIGLVDVKENVPIKTSPNYYRRLFDYAWSVD